VVNATAVRRDISAAVVRRSFVDRGQQTKDVAVTRRKKAGYCEICSIQYDDMKTVGHFSCLQLQIASVYRAERPGLDRGGGLGQWLCGVVGCVGCTRGGCRGSRWIEVADRCE